ncbi:MAG: cell division protein ZapA [Candidatus Omnitrophica bacterium]|nr:cell division protein ZapA [Candidatus Omnitrophota bacterium]
MPDKSEVITVEILGTTLQLRGGENPEAVMQACQIVYDQAEEIRKHAPNAPSIQIALMTAINLADELARAHGGSHEIEMATRKAQSILKKTVSAQT